VEQFPELAEFPSDLEPCADEMRDGRLFPGCYPPNWKDVPIGTEFQLEVLRYTTHYGLDADEAIDKLRRDSKVTCKICHGQARGYKFDCGGCHGKGYQPGPRVLSAPGGRLLEIVKPKDPAVRAEAERPERL
jgi:mono/diheme cytochrome c family protein